MELKLVVLAGAKEGTQIPLKKDKFIIGRASECNLRAGSSAISRRHCALVRKNDAWILRDLGSRNGTQLNDISIGTEPTLVKVGDEIKVGPLHFRVEHFAKAADESKMDAPAPKPAADAGTTASDSLDIKRGKQPPVKDVAEVAERTAKQSNGATSEEDISRWLLGIEAGGDLLKETQTLSMEDTTAISRTVSIEETSDAEPGDVAESDPANVEAEKDDASGSSGWGFFKLGKKGAAKKSPGKLPPRPAEISKDSREAAADILREMTRRR